MPLCADRKIVFSAEKDFMQSACIYYDYCTFCTGTSELLINRLSLSLTVSIVL